MAAPGGVALPEPVTARVTLPAGPALIGLSGGADSAILAWVASQNGEPARAVFVDHQLPASGRLREAAEQIAAAVGLSFDVRAAPVDEEAPSFEDAARSARYAALFDAAKPDEWILTGHTADDQAETVLGNLLRGAGAGGLAGIPAQRGRLVRPLLAVSRADTRRAARALGLPFFDDPDNGSLRRRRNRLRTELIPQLEADYNPQLRDALSRTAVLMGADDALLEEAAERIPLQFDGEAAAVPATALAVLPGPVANRVIRRAIRTVRGPHGGSYDEVEATAAVASGRRAGAELEGGLTVGREGPMLVISTGPPPPAPPVGMKLPGSVVFDRWRVTVELVERAPVVLGNRRHVLDAGVVSGEAAVRAAVAADRIELGAGSKRVGDALAEAGIPTRYRARYPVVEAGGRVALIPGVRAAAWAWRTPKTARYLVARVAIAEGF
ncbi:MAG: tRNA lysidine(34) synthetase TilS [Acidimicrobiia bacterium]|nr:tRNA lysidine(34) synthetase TilS [Acidimicrobiia bacterium]